MTSKPKQKIKEAFPLSMVIHSYGWKVKVDYQSGDDDTDFSLSINGVDFHQLERFTGEGDQGIVGEIIINGKHLIKQNERIDDFV